MKNLFLLSLILFGAFSLTAQNAEKKDYTLQSSAFNDDRTISVYLPPVYFESDTDSFNVIYILDGHYPPFIDLCAKVIEYGVHNYKFTNNIVVAIHQKNRGWEFSNPLDDNPNDEINYEKGRAPELTKHLKEEVFTFVDSLNLRTRDFRTIIGHSAGGFFVLNTLFSDNNDLFDAYISISPGIRPNETNIVERIADYLEHFKMPAKYLYISSGTVGEREELFSKGVNSIDSILNIHQHDLIWKKSAIQSTDHFTCVAPSISESMMSLTNLLRIGEEEYTRLAMDSSVDISKHIASKHQSLLDKFGYYDIPPAPYLRSVAYYIHEKGHNEAALAIYDLALAHYSDNFKIHRSRAKILKALNKKEEAHSAFKSAYDLLLKQPNSMNQESYDWYKKNIEEAIEETKP